MEKIRKSTSQPNLKKKEKNPRIQAPPVKIKIQEAMQANEKVRLAKIKYETKI